MRHSVKPPHSKAPWSTICDILYRTPEREGGTETPVRGTGKTPGKVRKNGATGFRNESAASSERPETFGNILRNNLKLWRITLWYPAEEHSRIGCPLFSMIFSMMTSDISET